MTSLEFRTRAFVNAHWDEIVTVAERLFEKKRLGRAEIEEISLRSCFPDPALVRGKRYGIVVADWNPAVTGALAQGAFNTFLEAGIPAEDIHRIDVPGSFELPSGAQHLIRTLDLDAVVCLGCVIQGETRHFEFISQAVAQGVMKLSLDTGRPIIFGVLTTDNLSQALERAGGQHGNKGVEAAAAALMMTALPPGN